MALACLLPVVAGALPGCLDCTSNGVAIGGVPRNYTAVPSGQTWFDTDGMAIYAQGGGFLKVDATYYWVGQVAQPLVQGLPPPEGKVNMYASEDLLNWRHVGAVLTVYTKDTAGNQPLTYCNIERPKLLYNAKTKKYVLWAHWEQHSTYSASHVITATADKVEGPYTLTAQGHRRPGSGNTGANAMGDRMGGLIRDYNTGAKDPNDKSHPLKPFSDPGYPPKIYQYSDPNPEGKVNYVSNDDYGTAQCDNWWTYQLSNVHFSMTLKAVAVRMTPYDATAYLKYTDKYSLAVKDYVVRYPTATKSTVAVAEYTIDTAAPSWRSKLVPPQIRPGQDESLLASAVLMNLGDAAFITVDTDNAAIYYTTDGTDPHTSNTTKQYTQGMRLVLQGQSMTVKAISSLGGKNSSVVSQVYQQATNQAQVPTFRPVINYPTGVYNSSSAAFGWKALRVYSPSNGTEVYYTMDGKDPAPAQKGENVGYGSRDMTVWEDPKTGLAYLISAQDNVFGRIWQLNDDWTDVVPEKEYDLWTAVSREAPALVRNGGAGGKYVYLITSTQSGYFPNQGQYIRSNNLEAGFNLPRDSTTGYRDGQRYWSKLHPFGDATTFYSQSTYILDIGTPAKPVYIYAGDRYNTKSIWRSNVVWMPLEIDDTKAGEDGDREGGSLRVSFQPNLQIDVAGNQIVAPNWTLLSLNKPVQASPATTPPEGTTANYSAAAANDGRNFDKDVYDVNASHFYFAAALPYYWRVDLEQPRSLAWVGLSFKSVGGSDAVNRYTLTASLDGKRWIEIADNTKNSDPGFIAHMVEGSYRYVQVNVFSVFDVDHNKEADWESGLYQLSVYGN